MVKEKKETEDRNMREGNSKSTGREKTLEPVTTLFDEEKFIRILIELPGIAEEKIRIDLDKNSVIIRASDTVKQYKKTIRIPIDARFCKKRFSDGVLELILEKQSPPRSDPRR
jgi:HSP20 family protein